MVFKVRGVRGGGIEGTKSSLRIGKREDGRFVEGEGGGEEMGSWKMGRLWVTTSGSAASRRLDLLLLLAELEGLVAQVGRARRAPDRAVQRADRLAVPSQQRALGVRVATAVALGWGANHEIFYRKRR